MMHVFTYKGKRFLAVLADDGTVLGSPSDLPESMKGLEDGWYDANGKRTKEES